MALRGRRGVQGFRGDRGIRGDSGYDDSEIILLLDKINCSVEKMSDIQGVHSTELAVIKQQVVATNGTVKKNSADIEVLFRLTNEDDRKWASLMGSMNAYRYLPIILGAIAAVLGIYAFFVKP